MIPAFIVATREYRQLTSTRSFWITLLAIPLIIVFLLLIPTLYRHPPGTVAFMLLDRTGLYGAEIDNRVELDYQKSVLDRVTEYAKHWHVHSKGPAEWSDRAGRLIDDTDAQAFVAAGGIDAALAEILPLLPPDAEAFVMPPRRLVKAAISPPLPPDPTPEQFGAAVQPLLSGDVDTPKGPLPLSVAIYVPPDPSDRTQSIQVWTTGRPGGEVAGIVSGVVLHAIRVQMMQRHGIDPAIGMPIEMFAPTTRINQPSPGTGANRIAVRSVVPLALAYLLLITIIVSGTMMLQGVIEERSNKLIETVLACISAEQLMQGKLIGVGAVGLSIVATWLAFAVVGANWLSGDLAETLRPALQTLHSPLVVLSMVFYFFTGYLVTSMLFLSIGAMSDSMQDAQGYLMPLVLVLTGPFVALIGTVVDNPDGTFPVVLSWIPLYTPFAMLARLGGGVSLGQILGTSALLLLFVIGEFIVLGRVFRASLLRTGQPPRLSGLLRMMFVREQQ